MKKEEQIVYISLDFHFELNGKLYLVEVDLCNETKGGRIIVMNEVQREYLKMVAEYEEKVYGYSEKIKFRDRLLEIVNKQSTSLNIDELRDANNLLRIIQDEINNS